MDQLSNRGFTMARVSSVLHFALCTLHSALCVLHSALCTLHSALCTLRFALCTLHFALCTLHSALNSVLASILGIIIYVCLFPKLAAMRNSAQIRGERPPSGRGLWWRFQRRKTTDHSRCGRARLLRARFCNAGECYQEPAALSLIPTSRVDKKKAVALVLSFAFLLSDI